MPQYKPKATIIEAKPLELAGMSLYAAAIDGKAHLIAADIFELFFSEQVVEQSGQITHKNYPPVKHTKASVKSRSSTPTNEKEASNKNEQTVTQRLVSLLRNGPLTSAEVGTFLYPDLQHEQKKQRDNGYAALRDTLKAGLINKHEDPVSGLNKWFLVEKTL